MIWSVCDPLPLSSHPLTTDLFRLQPHCLLLCLMLWKLHSTGCEQFSLAEIWPELSMWEDWQKRSVWTCMLRNVDEDMRWQEWSLRLQGEDWSGWLKARSRYVQTWKLLTVVAGWLNNYVNVIVIRFSGEKQEKGSCDHTCVITHSPATSVSHVLGWLNTDKIAVGSIHMYRICTSNKDII